MTYSRVKPAGWAFGEKLSSAEMNTLDTDHADAIDATTRTLGALPLNVSRRGQWLPTADLAANWDTLNLQLGYAACTTVNANRVFWPFRLPHNATLNGIVVVIEPAGGHAALPIQMPGFELISLDHFGAVTTEIPFVVDTSANVAAYQTVHGIATPLALTIVMYNTSKHYTLCFSSEGSTNAIAGLKVFHYYYGYTMTVLDAD